LPWEDLGSESKAHPEACICILRALDVPLPPPVTSLSPPAAVCQPTAVALGTFDGLHAGHRRVISEARTLAAEVAASQGPAVPTVVSFWPHPREVLYGETRLRLDLPEEKLAPLDLLGIQQLVLLPFTPQLASLSPERFVAEVLEGQLGARCVAVGENFRFGARRSGDAELLAVLGQQRGIRVSVVPMLHDAAGRVSSSRIRQALAEGRLSEAEVLLGRPYRFEGLVQTGRGLGRQLGWPTANLQVSGRKFLPMEGVYAAWAWMSDPRGGPPMAAVMNLGGQPTVDPEAPSAVEVHLLDREVDLVGRGLVVQPIRWLRAQCRFANVEALCQQIACDVETARAHLVSHPLAP
jgi:riboflavin kinase/FMN adenylyltransferase